MSQTNWANLTGPQKGALIKPMIEDQQLSYSQIGKILGVSRVAIAGAANRNDITSPYSRGVKGKGKKGAAALHQRAQHKSAATKRKAPGKQPTQAKRPHAFVAGYIPEAIIDRRPARADAWNALPGTTPRPLHELEAYECRWPTYIDGPPYTFCGAPAADGPWCPEHRLLAYKPRTPVKFSGRRKE